MNAVWQSRNRHGARTVPVRSAFATGWTSGSSKVNPQAKCCDRGPVALRRFAPAANTFADRSTVWQSRNRHGARTVPVRSAFATGWTSGSSKVKPQAKCCDRGPVALQRFAQAANTFRDSSMDRNGLEGSAVFRALQQTTASGGRTLKRTEVRAPRVGSISFLIRVHPCPSVVRK